MTIPTGSSLIRLLSVTLLSSFFLFHQTIVLAATSPETDELIQPGLGLETAEPDAGDTGRAAPPAKGHEQAAYAALHKETPLEDETSGLGFYFSDELLVEAPTRYPKPITQIAENVTLVTAEEIKAMNVRSVADLLHRVAGVFVGFNGEDVSSNASLQIQGSDFEHVLVLIDGVRWNKVAGGIVYTNNIPVQIIDRVEVIKGPASSTWGSSLGGVINIITKDTGKALQPSGEVSASSGEHDTWEYNGQLDGKIGNLGYYLFAGRQDCDGIKDDRFFDNDSFYSKLSLDLPRDIGLELTLGYSAPEYEYIHFEPYDFYAQATDRNFFYTATFSSMLTESVSFSLSLHALDDNFGDKQGFLSTGDRFSVREYDQRSKGVSSLLTWKPGRHTFVLGAEHERSQVIGYDHLAHYKTDPDYDENLALYVNDTIRLGRFTLTPGVRYDAQSIADDLVNPSLGLTYRLGEETLLRTLVSHGFRKPYPTEKSDDDTFYYPNPDLEAEKIWTYQAGVETAILRYCLLKTTLFFHDADEVWKVDPDGWFLYNDGTFRRKGMEFEVRSAAFHNLSVGASYTYVHQEPQEGDNDYMYNAKLILDYNDKNTFQSQLFGHYVWWGAIESPDYCNGDFDTFVWDLTLTKKIFSRKPFDTEIFFTAHNLFDGNQYEHWALPNAGRWIEAGLRFRF